MPADPQSPTEEMVMESPASKESLLHFLAISLAFGLAIVGLWASFGRGDLTNYAGLGDLYPRWYGAREALLHHRNPYSPEVSKEIQTSYYGHALAAGEAKDEQRFAYPVYAVWYLWPTLSMPFEQVRYLCALILLAAVIASVLCWVRMVYGYWKPALFASLIAMGSIPTIQAVKIQQLAALVIALMSLGVFAALRQRLVLSGVLFALATIKPQLVILPLAWMLFWSLTRWRVRKGFALGFVTATALLVSLGELAVPGWPRFFWQGLLAYSKYTDSSGVLAVLFGKPPGYLVAVFLIMPVIAIAYRLRTVRSDGPEFLSVCALVFCGANACENWLAAPFNQFLLIPALVLLVRRRAIVRYVVVGAILVPSVFAMLNHSIFAKYLVVPVVIQLALPACVLLTLLYETWAHTPVDASPTKKFAAVGPYDRLEVFPRAIEDSSRKVA